MSDSKKLIRTLDRIGHGPLGLLKASSKITPKVAPVAGAVVGGIYGGPAGATAGYAAGSALAGAVAKVPEMPGVPTIDEATRSAQATNRIRQRRGVLANVYAGASGGAPTTGVKTLLGS